MPESSLPLPPLPPRFRWMRGMRTNRSEVVYEAADEDGVLRLADPRGVVRHVLLGEMADRRPDLNDPATVGAIAALVREVWGAPAAYALHHSPAAGWLVLPLRDEANRNYRGPTEGAAWWAALEAAP